VNENKKSTNPKVVARRRLIRGAFAAPEALTLCSGSALAASSSSLRRLANMIESGNAELEADPGAAWIRVKVYKSGNDRLVSAAEVRAYGNVDSGFLPSTASWAKVADSTPYDPRGGTPDLTKNPLEYVALRFDKDGDIIGVASQSFTGGTAVTQSAWCSFGAVTCN
jgi:hypothetical protein